MPGEPVFPGEEDLIANAVDSRRREFVTARRCAREALAKLGHAPGPIRVGPRREPQWPTGLVGSITHTAAFGQPQSRPGPFSRASASIPSKTTRLPDGVEELVVNPGEAEMLAALTRASPDVLAAATVKREGVHFTKPGTR